MYSLRARKPTNYFDLNNGLFVVPVHATTSPFRQKKQRTSFKAERRLFNYMLAEALTKKRQLAVQTISIAISNEVAAKLEVLGVKHSFSQHEQLFHAFDLKTVVVQKNKQTLFEFTYKKTADQLAVKLRKKKQIAIEQENGETLFLSGITYLVIRFKVVDSVVESSN